MSIYRQGDVLLIKANIPADAEIVNPDNRNRYVIAEGEATGHAHAIQAVDTVEVRSLAESLFVSVSVETELIHEEHDTIVLPPGDYRVVRQVEYTPERLRRVLD